MYLYILKLGQVFFWHAHTKVHKTATRKHLAARKFLFYCQLGISESSRDRSLVFLKISSQNEEHLTQWLNGIICIMS